MELLHCDCLFSDSGTCLRHTLLLWLLPSHEAPCFALTCLGHATNFYVQQLVHSFPVTTRLSSGPQGAQHTTFRSAY